MAYLRWSNSPLYVYWHSDDKEDRLVVHLDIETKISATYEELVKNRTLLTRVLEEHEAYKVRDIDQLYYATEMFILDVKKHRQEKKDEE